MTKKLYFGGGAVVVDVAPAPYRVARAWRATLQIHAGSLSPLLSGVGNGNPVAGVDERIVKLLIGIVDVLFDLIADYSPAFAAVRERVEDVATDREIVAAFVEVLKLAYPFGDALTAITSAIGGSTPTIGRN